MTYNKLYFMTARGQANRDASPLVSSPHVYKKVDETLAQITAGGYFPAYFGFSAADIKNDDLLHVSASDRDGLFKVSTVSTTPTFGSNIYDQIPTNGVVDVLGTSNLSFTGITGWVGAIPAVSPNVAQGNQFTITIPTVSSSGTDYGVITCTVVFLSNHRPLVDIHGGINIITPSGDIPAYYTLTSTGNLSITAYSTPGAAAGNWGFRGFSLTYRVNP